MKRRTYYWIAIGVLVLGNLFFGSLAQIQSNYAKEAVVMAEQQRISAENQANLAVVQLRQVEQIVQERAAEAEMARNQAEAMMQKIKECEAKK